jgi:hypothetical protein
MQGCIKSATCNVNQKGEFWCYFIMTSKAGKHLNQGYLTQVLLYTEN